MANVFARFPGEHIPRIPVYSTLTGRLFQGSFSPDYYWKNNRQPVLFTEAMTTLLTDVSTGTFIELSPHPVLASYLASMGVKPTAIICPMKRTKDPSLYHETTIFLDSIGRLVMTGYNGIDFQTLNGVDHVDKACVLPPYPFVRKEIAYFSDSSRIMANQFSSRNGPLNYEGLRMSAKTHPILSQHIIRNESIMPAAGYLEMVSLIHFACQVAIERIVGFRIWSENTLECGLSISSLFAFRSCGRCCGNT